MNEKNMYVKILSLIMIVFILVIIICSFIFSENNYVITDKMIICLILIVILILADSFDNLNIYKLLSLSKNIKVMKEENNELKETNNKLLEQLINIKNTNNQNVYLPNSFSFVGSSDINDINKRESNYSNNEILDLKLSNDFPNQKKSILEKCKYRKALEIYLLKKTLKDDVDCLNIQYNVKMIDNKPIKDNIMKSEMRFDAMKSDDENNIFYEVKVSPLWINYQYQLYYMLRMIELYQDTNKCKSKLVIILPKLDDALEKILSNDLHVRLNDLNEKMKKEFKPAIGNGLLEILQIGITKNELDKYLKQKEEK